VTFRNGIFENNDFNLTLKKELIHLSSRKIDELHIYLKKKRGPDLS
jgi:hypothetical protein